ncbi:MAG: glucosylceramidase [Clostridia bacterium]|nr:glucosylceramidase [Clostridia bacterium]
MKIKKYETNFKRNLFWNESILNTKSYSEKVENKVINIYPEVSYQTIIGFGGAFTESSGYAYSKLNNEKKGQLINDYFSPNGLNYSIARLPIGSSDFSLKPYSYSKKADLSDFNISKDKEYLLPFLQDVLHKKGLKLLASPWSPPSFMKTTKMLTLGGKLANKYNQTWADYLALYIKAYLDEGIHIDYITVQNEPNAVQLWESCLYSPEEEASFATNYLYYTFVKNNIDTKILIWDHNKEKLFTRALQELQSKSNLDAITGIAFHWYTGDHFENIELTHNAFPDKLLFHTEGCTGFSKFNPDEEIQNGEIYAHDILGDLNAGINAFLDWNLILDHKGGPNHKRNYCNSPIMLTEDSSDYVKNLTYYYIGHFSRFIKPDSKRIAFSRYTDKIELTSFKNADGSIVVVLLNRSDTNYEYNLCINDIVVHDNLDSHAIVTLLL